MSIEVFSTKFRNNIGITGLISFVLGLLILFFPGKTAGFIALLTGIALFLIGLFYLFWGLNKGSDESVKSDRGHFMFAILYFALAIFMFINVNADAKYLLVIIGIIMGITWIGEGLVNVAILRETVSLGSFWLYLSTIVTIIAGIALLFSPLYTVTLLWRLFGIALSISGVSKMIHFFTWQSN